MPSSTMTTSLTGSVEEVDDVLGCVK